MSAVGRRLLGAGLALGLAVLLGGGLGGLAAALDFNGASLEDWLGPFREQGRALVEGRAELVEAFVYPPSAAVLLAPLGTLGPSGAEALGWFVQLLCVGLLAALGPRLAGVRWSGILDLAFGLAVGLCVPVLHSVHWGQLGAPLAVLVLLWLLAGRSEGGSDEQAGRVREVRTRSTWAGDVALSLAVGLKVYPLLVALPRWAVHRPGRRALLLLLAVVVALPWLVMGADAAAFAGAVAERVRELSSEGGGWWGSANRQSVAAVIGRAVGAPGPPAFLSVVTLVAFAALAVGAARLARDPRPRALETSGLLLLTGLVLLPGPCWPHHLATLPLLWAVALGGAVRARPWVLASIVTASLPLHLALGGWEVAYTSGLPLVATLLAAVGAMAGLSSRADAAAVAA